MELMKYLDGFKGLKYHSCCLYQLALSRLAPSNNSNWNRCPNLAHCLSHKWFRFRVKSAAHSVVFWDPALKTSRSRTRHFLLTFFIP